MPTPPDPELPPALRDPLSPTAVALLESRLPARLAWTTRAGAPRVAPIWFHWTGARLELATFAGAAKLRDLVAGDTVAVTIDTDQFPYRSLALRGPVELHPTAGIAPSYRLAVERYLGPTTAERWLRFLGDADQVVLSVAPARAVVYDMAVDSAFFATAADAGP